MKKVSSVVRVAAGCVLMAAAVSGGEEKSADPVVVTATRVPASSGSVASSITVISAEEIEQRQFATVLDAVQDVPGVVVQRNGGLGASSSVFIRGGKSEHVLVLVDGVELNDPGTAGRAPDLSILSTKNVERIELLRGPQSSLYGSDAISGVLNIITKKGEGPPVVSIETEAGSFATYRAFTGVSGGSENGHYAVSAAWLDTEGFSSANEKDGNTEKDGHRETVFSGRAGATPSKDFSVDFSVRYSDSETEYDAGAGPGADSPDNYSTKQSLLARAEANLALLNDVWKQKLAVSMATHDREFFDMWGGTMFDSELLSMDWQNDLFLGDANILTLGAAFDREESKTESVAATSSDVVGFFAQEQINLGESFLAAFSLRMDDHDTFGSEWTYRVAPLFIVPGWGTRIKATYGTGFKAPSLYQLFAPATAWGRIGNSDLQPEKSTGGDAGIEQPLLDGKGSVGATYFFNRLSDMIEFEDGYVNKSRVETRGVEGFARMRMGGGFSVGANYTYTDTEDRDTGLPLIRRPKNQWAANLNYGHPKVNLNVSVLHVGKRDDRYYDSTMFTSVNAEVDAYTVVNLAGSYKISDQVELFGRVENLFDEEYEEIKGYGTAGLSGYGGVKVTL